MKRFIYFFFSFSLVFNTILFAQSITWQRTYDGPLYHTDFGYDMCTAPVGCFYFVGYLYNYNVIGDYIYIIKINSLGDTLWSKQITEAGISLRAYSCAMSHDSGCVLTGDGWDSSYAIKIDRNGNIVWQKHYDAGNITCWEIKQTFDKGFITCGIKANSAIPVGYILKIDSLGNLQWQRNYPAVLRKWYYSLEEIPGSGYFATGFVDINSYDSSKAILDKINYSGDLVWEKSYSINKYNYGQKIKKINNNLLIGGYHCPSMSSITNTFLLKIDQNGNLVNSHIFPNNNYEFLDDIAFISPNKFAITLRQDTVVNLQVTYAKILILDSSYNLLYFKKLPSYRYSSLTSIIPLINGDIVFGGTFDYYNYWPNRGADFYAVRTDSLLNSPPLPPIGISNNNNQQPINFYLHQNYPNPFNPKTHISFDLPKDMDIKLTVYDVLGREVYSIHELYKAGSNKIEFDGSNLASGVYYYSLEAGTFAETKKMVLIK